MVHHADGFVSRAWESLHVGDIIKVEKDGQLPCDILLLYSSEEKGNCFIETKNLDGETNLKEKKSSVKLQELFKEGRESTFSDINLKYTFERPNPYLYNFTGKLELPDGTSVPLDNNSFILRGCILRNTKFVYGVVTYNGQETKVMLNSIKAQPKMSSLEKKVNKQIIILSMIQLSLSMGFAIISVIYQSLNVKSKAYMEYESDKIFNDRSAFTAWPMYLGKWLLILNNFIPISLLVSHEMVKYIQAMMIGKDQKMESTLYGKISTVAQSSSLTEELGQVNYVFSDKTGTLTCNIMNFKKLFSGGHSYGETYAKTAQPERPDLPNVDVRDPKLFQHLAKTASGEEQHLDRTLKFLGLCHTALVEGEGSDFTYGVDSTNLDKFAGRAGTGQLCSFLRLRLQRRRPRRLLPSGGVRRGTNIQGPLRT